MSGNAKVAMFLTFYYMCRLLWFTQRLFCVRGPAVIGLYEPVFIGLKSRALSCIRACFSFCSQIKCWISGLKLTKGKPEDL